MRCFGQNREEQGKFQEKQGKFREEAKWGQKMKVWNIRDNFGQPGQVRLRRDGGLEIRNNGQKLWRLIGYIDISLFSDKEIEKRLKQTQGISKVTRR